MAAGHCRHRANCRWAVTRGNFPRNVLLDFGLGPDVIARSTGSGALHATIPAASPATLNSASDVMQHRGTKSQANSPASKIRIPFWQQRRWCPVIYLPQHYWPVSAAPVTLVAGLINSRPCPPARFFCLTTTRMARQGKRYGTSNINNPRGSSTQRRCLPARHASYSFVPTCNYVSIWLRSKKILIKQGCD